MQRDQAVEVMVTEFGMTADDAEATASEAVGNSTRGRGPVHLGSGRFVMYQSPRTVADDRRGGFAVRR
jgi:hypothetical protein